MQITDEALQRRYSYHLPPSPELSDLFDDVRTACYRLGRRLRDLLPDSAEAENALDRLDEVMFWGNASIARWVVAPCNPAPAASHNTTVYWPVPDRDSAADRRGDMRH